MSRTYNNFRSRKQEVSGSDRLAGAGGSFIIDNRGTILGFDDGMEQLTGWPAYKIVGRNKEATTSENSLPLYNETVTIPENSATILLVINRHDGRSLGVEAEITKLPGKGEQALISILRVVTRSAMTSSRFNQDDIDSLTGLMNPKAFYRQLNTDIRNAWETASPLALIISDIDHFRKVNDIHGRLAGDQVLAEMADILRVTVGDDHLIARLDADDFVILLPNSGRGEARQLAATLRSTVEQHRFHGAVAGDIRITTSIGASSFPADAESPDDLIARARDALSEAQGLGRNRVWCYLRRPRVPVEVPIFYDGVEGLLVGYSRDLSPSGIFVQTASPINIGMRCALTFPLPGHDGNVHVIGRIVRSVPPNFSTTSSAVHIPGMGVEFEQFGGPEDRHAIELFLHDREATTLRPERAPLSGV